MNTPSELWLGLALRSETDQPHEWIPVGWVIRNRLEHRNYPSSYYKVITAARQFSYFNQFRGTEDESNLFEEAYEGYAGDRVGWVENDFHKAVMCAGHIIHSPRWMAPFGPNVLNFWSPVSMVPSGSHPSWASNLNWITLPGISKNRFIFGETA